MKTMRRVLRKDAGEEVGAKKEEKEEDEGGGGKEEEGKQVVVVEDLPLLQRAQK